MKTNLKPFRKYVLHLILILVLLLWFRSCREATELTSRYENNLGARESQLRSYKLSNGQLAFEKELLTVTNGELKDQVWVKDDSLKLLLKKLKDPVTTIKWETQYVYDTVFLPFDAPVDLEFQRRFSRSDEWFSLSGTVTQEGVSVEKLFIPNTQRLVVGYRKDRPVVSVTNSNPHILTDAIEGQLVRVPQNHWVLGLGATWNIYGPPCAGFFLGYKLFEF